MARYRTCQRISLLMLSLLLLLLFGGRAMFIGSPQHALHCCITLSWSMSSLSSNSDAVSQAGPPPCPRGGKVVLQVTPAPLECHLDHQRLEYHPAHHSLEYHPDHQCLLTVIYLIHLARSIVLEPSVDKIWHFRGLSTSSPQ